VQSRQYDLLEVEPGQAAFPAVRPYPDPDVFPGAGQSLDGFGHGGPRVSLFVDRNRVLQIQDDRVSSRRHRLVHPVRLVAGNEQH
jgi:hypothetical protein